MNDTPKGTPADLGSSGQNIPDLSQREIDCLRFLATGHRIDKIATHTGLARVTVELHLRNARLKLAAATLHEAVAKAVRQQVI